MKRPGHSLYPPSLSLGDGGEGRGLSHFSVFQNVHRSNWDFGWKLALQVGVIFFRWDLKTSCIKNSKYKSQAKKINKKNDSDCNFYNFSLLVPYPNKFVVVCICIVIFHGMNSPQATNIFFCGGLNFFFVSWSQRLGIFQISSGPSVLEGRGVGGPNFLFGRGGLVIFHKVTNDQSCKLKNN